LKEKEEDLNTDNILGNIGEEEDSHSSKKKSSEEQQRNLTHDVEPSVDNSIQEGIDSSCSSDSGQEFK
jgi:hypothetical protein